MTPSKTASKTAKADPVKPQTPDLSSREDDETAVVNQFAEVVSGKHKGRYGAVVEVASRDEKTGLPKSLVLRTRDAEDERLVIDQDDLRPAEAGRR